jgi:hypothetical protein
VNKQDLSDKKRKKSPKFGCKGALGIKYIAVHRVAQFIFGRSVRNWAQNDTEKQAVFCGLRSIGVLLLKIHRIAPRICIYA